jgi:hypothetical protein
MASLEHYTALIQAFCRQTGIADVPALLEGGVISVDGFNLKMVYGEQVNPEVMFVYCEYGEVPPERAAEVYEVLLRWNAIATTGVSPCYAMSPGNRTLIYIHPLMVRSTTPEQLLQAISEIAQAARGWRANNYFLDAAMEPEDLPPPAARSSAAFGGLRL